MQPPCQTIAGRAGRRRKRAELGCWANVAQIGNLPKVQSAAQQSGDASRMAMIRCEKAAKEKETMAS